MSEEMLFHCLSLDEWVRVTIALSYSEVKVLYYLLCQNPMGDRKVDCRVRSVAQIMKMSTGAVSQAIKQLERKGFIDSVEIVQAIISFKPRLISERAQRYLAKNGLEPLRGESVHSSEHQVQPIEQVVHSSEHQVQPIEQLHNKERARVETFLDLSQTLSDKRENDNKNQKTTCVLEKPEEVKPQSSASVNAEVETQQTSLTISSSGTSLAGCRDPFYSQRTDPKDIQWDWLPEGPWKTEQGKIDSNFQTAIAQRWIKEHGGDLHEKKANVLKHFKNDPANLPIEWEWYQSTILDKAANIQTRKLNGVDTASEEQEILEHKRAIAELPQEMRVTEERTALRSSASLSLQGLLQISHTLAPISQDCHLLMASSALALKDEFGTISPQSYYNIDTDAAAYWENVYARCASTQKTKQEQPTTTADELSEEESKAKARALIESLAMKRERPKSLTSIAEVFSPKEPYAATLEDMRKYLTSGSDVCRQIALDWASDPINGCELVKRNGRVVDIREMEF